MLTVINSKNYGYQPAFLCDVCGKVIKDMQRGLVATTKPDKSGLYFFHEGCRDKMEDKLDEISTPVFEVQCIDLFLHFLERDIKRSPAGVQRTIAASNLFDV